jgi:hypothetical protein
VLNYSHSKSIKKKIMLWRTALSFGNKTSRNTGALALYKN